MDPEVQALIAVYQKRLADVTAQAIAYEARIAILSKQMQELNTTTSYSRTSEKTNKK